MAGTRVSETRLMAIDNGPDVSAVSVMPSPAIAMMVLGHGAGTPIHNPLMAELAEALASHGIASLRYNYPYSEGIVTDYSRGVLDPLDVLISTTSSAKRAAKDVSPDLPLFLGGRSMSSQVMTVAMAREDWPDVRGVVLYVFPMRWHDLLEDTVSHLQQVPTPMLFVQGSCDDLTDVGELRVVLEGIGQPCQPARRGRGGPFIRHALRVRKDEIGCNVRGRFSDCSMDSTTA